MEDMTWAVHRGVELLGISGYTVVREYQNNAMKRGFRYEEGTDRFKNNAKHARCLLIAQQT